jgi:hypothetical protein
MNEQQLAAVKQALEALESERDKYLEWGDEDGAPEDVYEAITALQSIISQDALDKMAENARELGLDYEPAVQEGRVWAVFCGGCRKEWSVPYQHPGKSICAECEAKCKDTPPAAQPAVQEGRDWSLLEATQESLREHMAEIKRLKAAQPAPLTCKHEWFRTGAMEPGECRCINCGMWNTTTPPVPQPVPVKTYSGGKPWPVQPVPHECQTEAEKTAYAFGWWKAMEYVREHGVIK